MEKKPEAYVVELESKLNILERENEILSLKVEENLLLNKAFEEINSFDDGDNLLSNTLESISILLDIQFVGIFELKNSCFTCFSSYILFFEENTIDVTFKVSEEQLPLIQSDKTCYLTKNEAKLILKKTKIEFSPHNFIVVPSFSNIDKNRYFVLANDDGNELKTRIPLLEKVIQIISAKRERIFYQNELKKLNKKLNQRNKTLEKTNEVFAEKNRIINEQNAMLMATMKNLKEAQSHLIQSEKMASLGVLTAGVAHEINNPLNFILGGYVGLARYLSANGHLNNEKVAKMLEIIKTGVERTANIVKSLNQFSRHKDNFDEQCDLHSIIDNCLVMLNNQLKHRVAIIKKFSAKRSIVIGNIGRLHQVLLNILTNASQAIKNEGTITILTNIEAENIAIKLIDTGCGIAEENLSKITDPFFTTKDPDKGTGLGLSIAYGIISDHGGTIAFKSKVNKGTEVKITLPLKK